MPAPPPPRPAGRWTLGAVFGSTVRAVVLTVFGLWLVAMVAWPARAAMWNPSGHLVPEIEALFMRADFVHPQTQAAAWNAALQRHAGGCSTCRLPDDSPGVWLGRDREERWNRACDWFWPTAEETAGR